MNKINELIVKIKEIASKIKAKGNEIAVVVSKWTNVINAYTSAAKQSDKWEITLRGGKFTLLDIKYDHSKKECKGMIANLGIKIKPPKKSSK